MLALAFLDDVLHRGFVSLHYFWQFEQIIARRFLGLFSTFAESRLAGKVKGRRHPMGA